MNTIKRPRRRPREESINFRTFFWLLRREAMLAIWFEPGVPPGFRSDQRHAVLTTHPFNCLSCTQAHAVYHPEHRYVP